MSGGRCATSGAERCIDRGLTAAAPSVGDDQIRALCIWWLDLNDGQRPLAVEVERVVLG